MIEEETAGRLELHTLREAIERRDPELLLGFYAEDAELRVVNGGSAQGPAFGLRGKGQIGRYLHVVFDQRTPSRIEGELVMGEDLICFEDVCEYPDGTRVVVTTTLKLSEGRIWRQLDVVERARAVGAGEGGER